MARFLLALAVLVALYLLFTPRQEQEMEILRTPDERFANLPDWPYEPRYVDVQGLRIHYVDEGPRDGRIVWLLHGEPSWAFLYRKMIPVLTAAGLRPIAPDLVGFGRSDKYADLDAYSYQLQVDVMADFARQLAIEDAVFFGQDWGGLVGLRVVAEHPERFAAVVVGNTALPEPREGASPPMIFRAWQTFARWSPVFPTSRILQRATTTELPAEVLAAYDAPFPTRAHQAGARIMPSHVPITADDPALPATHAAWQVFHKWEKPFLTAFSDKDPITRGLEKRFQEEIPGAQGPEVVPGGAEQVRIHPFPDDAVHPGLVTRHLAHDIGHTLIDGYRNDTLSEWTLADWSDSQCVPFSRSPFGTKTRSESSKAHLTSSAIIAAGMPPSSMSASLFRRRPVMMG